MLSIFPIVTQFPVHKGQEAKVWFSDILPVICQIDQKQGRTHFAEFNSPYQIKLTNQAGDLGLNHSGA